MERLRDVARIVAIATFSVAVAAAENPRQAFTKAWEGRVVVVRQTLYTLVYNERGKLGNTSSGRREGLIVATPSQGAYFQFDGRHGRDDVVTLNPQRMIDAVRGAYEPDSSIDVRAYRKIDPVALNRYEAGVELIVRQVRIDRDIVKLTFGPAAGGGGEDELATSLTIKWPLPVSKSFTERDQVESLIRQFVEPRRTS